jgi:hypothetical protein
MKTFIISAAVMVAMSALAVGWASNWSSENARVWMREQLATDEELRVRDAEYFSQRVRHETHLDKKRRLDALAAKHNTTIDQLYTDERFIREMGELEAEFITSHSRVNVTRVFNRTIVRMHEEQKARCDRMEESCRKDTMVLLMKLVWAHAARGAFFALPSVSCLIVGIFNRRNSVPFERTAVYTFLVSAFLTSAFHTVGFWGWLLSLWPFSYLEYHKELDFTAPSGICFLISAFATAAASLVYELVPIVSASCCKGIGVRIADEVKKASAEEPSKKGPAPVPDSKASEPLVYKKVDFDAVDKLPDPIVRSTTSPVESLEGH